MRKRIVLLVLLILMVCSVCGAALPESDVYPCLQGFRNVATCCTLDGGDDLNNGVPGGPPGTPG